MTGATRPTRRTGDRYSPTAPTSASSGPRNAANRSPIASATSPAMIVPASCANTPSTRTVALTRPSSRSPTRDWRSDTSVTSNIVIAESPTSCWTRKKPTATSGRPAGDSGISRLATAPTTTDTTTSRPSPNRPTVREASSAPASDPIPPIAATTPITRGVEADLAGREQQPGRPEHAPHRGQPHRPPQQAAQDRVAGDDREPAPDLAEDRLPVLGRRRRRLGPSDRAQEHAPTPGTTRCPRAIAIGAVSTRTSTPPMPNPANSTADSVAASAPLARTRSSRPTTTGRYALSATSKNVVRTAAPAATRTPGAARASRRAPRWGSTPSSAARPRSAQIMTGRRRSRSTQAPATNPTSSAATSSIPAEDGDVDRSRPERLDRDERQRDPGHERPEHRHGGGGPQREEGAVASEPAAGRDVPRGRDGVEQRVRGHRREGTVGRPSTGAPSRRVTYTPHASVSPEPAHPPSGVRRAGLSSPSVTRVTASACSTASAIASERPWPGSPVAAACPRRTSTPRCARCGSRCSRPTSTSRWSRTSWPGCASARSVRRSWTA